MLPAVKHANQIHEWCAHNPTRGIPDMDESTFSCQFCGETQKWDSQQAADSAALWHLFEEHPLRWLAVVGDRYPADPPPTRVGHRLVRS